MTSSLDGAKPLAPRGFALEILEIFRTQPPWIRIKGFAAQISANQQNHPRATFDRAKTEMCAGEAATHDQDVLSIEIRTSPEIHVLAVL